MADAPEIPRTKVGSVKIALGNPLIGAYLAGKIGDEELRTEARIEAGAQEVADHIALMFPADTEEAGR